MSLNFLRPLLLFDKSYEFKFEIDISEYEIGEYIVFETQNDLGHIIFKYQYKTDFKQNNFIFSGKYYRFNYILIKKTKNDSSLLLNITLSSNYNLKTFSLIRYAPKSKEITLDNNNINIKGPQLLFLDYFTINNLKSFGIESNHSYFFLQQDIRPYFSLNYLYYYKNITIYKKGNYNSEIFKRAFIYFNTSDYISLIFQKFNFYIFWKILSI